MGRRKRPERVLRPYQERAGWRVVHVAADGTRTSRLFETEAKAKGHVRNLERLIAATEARTIGDAIDEYKKHQQAKRLRPKTLAGNAEAFARFFDDHDALLSSLTPARCAARYKALTSQYSVDTHRGSLNQSRSFLEWCVGEGWLRSNPLAGIKGIGKRKRGKPQLRLDEARRWTDKAFELAETWIGGLAALMAYFMDMRPSEIIGACVRDLDDDAKILWVADSKTEAGRRVLEIPDELQPLMRAAAEGKKGGDKLVGHQRLWVLRAVHRVCDAAGLDRVSAQAMRGLHASVAFERGATPHMIALAMGHSSPRVTRAHYATADSQRRGKQAAALKVIRGGKR